VSNCTQRVDPVTGRLVPVHEVCTEVAAEIASLTAALSEMTAERDRIRSEKWEAACLRTGHVATAAAHKVAGLEANLVAADRRGDEHLGAYHMEHALVEGLKLRLTELTKTLLEQATAWESNAVAWKGKTSKPASEVYAENAATLRWVIEHKEAS
jgi:hypothetical protein